MLNEKMVNLILGGAVAIGFVWTQLGSIPKLEEKQAATDVKVAVIESKLDTIGEGVKLLIRGQRASSRRNTDD